MKRRYYIAGFLLGLTAIILGAFATHGLKPLLSHDSMASFDTGVKFQIYHALLLLILGNFKEFPKKSFKIVFYIILVGIILFSGSIYLLSTNSLTGIDFKSIALLTPLGGSLLIFAWGILTYQAITLKFK